MMACKTYHNAPVRGTKGSLHYRVHYREHISTWTISENLYDKEGKEANCVWEPLKHKSNDIALHALTCCEVVTLPYSTKYSNRFSLFCPLLNIMLTWYRPVYTKGYRYSVVTICTDSIRPPEKFSGVQWRTHGRYDLKFEMLQYPDHFWKRFDFVYSWLIFLLVAQLRIGEMENFGVSGHFMETVWKEGLTLAMLMYHDHFQKWLEFGQCLLIFQLFGTILT